MKCFKNRALGLILSIVMILGCFGIMSVYADENFTCGGWFETLYAQWNDTNVAAAVVEYKKTEDTSYLKVDSELVRDYSGKGRVDIPGLSAGNYDIKITAGNGTVYSKENIMVKAHDRSGYAHKDYAQGVGAYKNDGTSKDNAIIVYVTDENKDTIEVSGYEDYGKGIGWLLNNNQEFVKKLASDNRPLIVRFIGKVNAPQGLTVYDSYENGGTPGDNGNMCIIKNSKNVTLEGIGDDAEIDGWGFSFYVGENYPNRESYEVRNLTFRRYPEDALGFQGYQAQSGVMHTTIERVWVHNCSFYPGYCENPKESDKKEGDGSCDFKRGQYYTMDYNYYNGCHKTNLVGANSKNMQYNMTFHHNFYENCGSRMPLVRQANIHIYNSYFKVDIGDKNVKASYIMSPRASSYIFSEANFFDSCKNPIDLSKAEGSAGAVKSYNDIFFNTSEKNDATIVKNRNETVSSTCKYANFDTQPDFYDYTATSAMQAKADCIAYSGAMKTPEEIVKNEDPEPEPIFAEPAVPVALPFSVTFNNTAADDYFGNILKNNGVANELAAGERKTINNVIYKPGKKYGITGTQYTIKDEGAIFKIDKKCLVTISSSGGTVAVALYNSEGGLELTIKDAEKHIVLEPGSYVVQSSLSTKEAVLCSLAIEEYSGGDIPDDETESTSEKATESTSEEVTESSTQDPDSEEDDKNDTENIHIRDFTNDINTNGFFDISGKTASKDITYNGQTLNKCLKMESSTLVNFKTSKKAVLTIVSSSTKNPPKIKLDGNSVNISQNGEIKFDIEPGLHTIKKDTTDTFIFIIKVAEESGGNAGDDNTEFKYNGDINGNGIVDVDDASSLLGYILDKNNKTSADGKPLNIDAAKITENDEEITAAHAAYILKIVLEGNNK